MIFKRSLAIALLLLLPPCAAQAERLNRDLGPDPDSLDIHQAQGLPAIQLLREIREGLFTFDAAGEIAPGVAAEWSVTEGNHSAGPVRLAARTPRRGPAGVTLRRPFLTGAHTLLKRDTPVIPPYYYVSRHRVKPGVEGFIDNVRDVHLSRYLDIDTQSE